MKYDLVDRRCVVTGASSGIGKEIARNLAYFGASVVLACRNRDAGSAALQEIVEDSGNDRLTMMQVDLSIQDSIRAFAHRVTSAGPLHVLVNNAGVMMEKREVTVDGHEMTWATNGLGYFMLANLLLPTLRKTPPARVVNVASKLAGRLRVDDLDFERRRYSGMAAYSQSKQANRMLSWGLDARTNAEVSVHACHPGAVASGLFRRQKGVRGKVVELVSRFLKAPGHGATTPTYLAADPDLHEQSGKFWVDSKPASCKFAGSSEIDALWSKCVEMTRSDV